MSMEMIAQDAATAEGLDSSTEIIGSLEETQIEDTEADVPGGEALAEEDTEYPSGGEEGAAAKTQADAAQAARDRTRAEVVRHLRELRANEQLKPIADALNKAWYREQEYSSLGDVKELRGIKEQLDILGGPEALNRFRDLEITVENIDRMVDSGDPTVIEDMFSESPEGMKKLVPVAIDKLRSIDPSAYASAIRPHIVQAIRGTNLHPTVHSLSSLIQRAYNQADPEHARFYLEQAFNYIKGIDEWLTGLAEEPEESSVRAAAQTAQTQNGGQNIREKIEAELVPWARGEFEKALKPFIGSQQVSQEKKNDLITLIAAEVDRTLGHDNTFRDNFQAWMNAGKADRALAQARHAISNVVGEAARRIWERHGVKDQRTQATGNGTGKKNGTQARAGNTQTQKPAKSQSIKDAILLPRKPSIDQLDMSRDPERLLYITHRGYLKDGRLVRW